MQNVEKSMRDIREQLQQPASVKPECRSYNFGQCLQLVEIGWLCFLHIGQPIISGNRGQKRTLDTPCLQGKIRILTSTYMILSRCKSYLRSVATRKPSSTWHISKLAKIWDDELTQSAHLHNPCLAIYIAIGYTFYFELVLCKGVMKYLTFDI